VKELAIVAVGGGIGAAMRYWLGESVAARLGHPAFPWGTFAVNVSGAFLIGIVMALFTQRGVLSVEWHLFLGVGILGGYTTFSTLSYQTVHLFEQGLYAQAGAYMLGSAAAGIVAVVAGLALGRAL
jgi:CrcB protein